MIMAIRHVFGGLSFAPFRLMSSNFITLQHSENASGFQLIALIVPLGLCS